MANRSEERLQMLYDVWCKGMSNDKVPKVLHDAYIDYNTTLPSSAPVERLFSLGKKVLSPTRTLLSDKHFEILIMLAASKHRQPM